MVDSIKSEVGPEMPRETTAALERAFRVRGVMRSRVATFFSSSSSSSSLFSSPRSPLTPPTLNFTSYPYPPTLKYQQR